MFHVEKPMTEKDLSDESELENILPSLTKDTMTQSHVTQPRQARCKWFEATKGYGFLVDIEASNEIFVHYSALRRASQGWRCLWTNEYVEYIAESSEQGPIATCVTGIHGGPLMCEQARDSEDAINTKGQGKGKSKGKSRQATPVRFGQRA
jgi:cold shock CspA family protein